MNDFTAKLLVIPITSETTKAITISTRIALAQLLFSAVLELPNAQIKSIIRPTTGIAVMISEPTQEPIDIGSADGVAGAQY